MEKKQHNDKAAKDTAKNGMSKKKIILLAAVIIVVVVAGIIAVTTLIGASQMNNYIAEQNYVASKLIETGDYEKGRVLALKSDNTRSNDIAKELILLSAGFQADTGAIELYAERYLDVGSEIVDGVYDLFFSDDETDSAEGDAVGSGTPVSASGELTEEQRSQLMSMLLKVQQKIKVKRNVATLQALVDAYASPSMSLPESIQNDASPLAGQIRIEHAVQNRDFDEAYELAEKQLGFDDSFSSRALLANIAATGELSAMRGENDISSKQREQVASLRSEMYELMNERDALYQNGDEIDDKAERSLTSEIEKLNEQIEALNDEIYSEPIKRAINYIETTTPLSQRDEGAYKLELAFLYYNSGNVEEAEKQLYDAISSSDAEDDTLSGAIKDLANNYINRTSTNDSYQLTVIWQRVCELMHFISIDEYFEDEFYNFLLDILEQFYRGLIIREIDTSDYPIIRVRVNVSSDEEIKLRKSDFMLDDMGLRLNSFKLLDSDTTVDEELSVMLVIDRSDSMNGTPLDDTKAAVTNFIKSMDDSTKLGLAAFESRAELLSELGESRMNILLALDSVSATGGTSIRSGLEVAGEELASVRDGRKIIILLSDGADGDAAGIDATLEWLNSQGIIVYTIGFGGADSAYLSKIAESCGGKYLSADSSKVLSEIYSDIGRSMTNDYILEFEAVTDVENYSRVLKIYSKKIGSEVTSEYHVGVKYDDIAAEDGQPPLFDAFRQIGGSAG